MTPTDLLNKWIAEARKEYEIAKIEQNLYKMKKVSPHYRCYIGT